MNEIHEGLADMDFETSATVQEATICTKTGLLARSSCPSITEYFEVSDLPTDGGTAGNSGSARNTCRSAF